MQPKLILGCVAVLLGLACAVYGAASARKTYRLMHRTHQTTCVLLGKQTSDSTRVQRGFLGVSHAARHHYEWARVSYTDDDGEHTVEGEFFPADQTETGESAGGALRRMKVGQRYPLWVDDDDPARVYLSRGDASPWTGVPTAVGGSVVALAGVGCLVKGARGVRMQDKQTSHF